MYRLPQIAPKKTNRTNASTTVCSDTDKSRVDWTPYVTYVPARSAVLIEDAPLLCESGI